MMRTYQKTVREGELLGPVDWNYDFYRHFTNYCCNDLQKAEMMARQIETLWQVERLHLKGVPMLVNIRDYWHFLYDVGMYDGWPYWKPTPALCYKGTLGPEWGFFDDLQEFKPEQP